MTETTRTFDTPSLAVNSRMASGLIDLIKHNRIALMGPHRTGKTTMAKAYAEAVGVPYYDASVSKILAEAGVDSSANYSKDFAKRLKGQRYLLERLDDIWDGIDGGFITDRSPLCMAMYTLADINGSTEYDANQYQQVVQYINDCKALTLKHFNTLGLLPLNPAIELVSVDKSPAANPAYIEHLYTIIQQLVATLNRRMDAAPELLDDDALAVVAPYPTRAAYGDRQRPYSKHLSELSSRVYKAFSHPDGFATVCMLLPHSVSSVEDRVEWLVNQQTATLVSWLKVSLSEAHNSPITHDMLMQQGQLRQVFMPFEEREEPLGDDQDGCSCAGGSFIGTCGIGRGL